MGCCLKAWTNVDISLVISCSIHLRAISRRAHKTLLNIMHLKIILLITVKFLRRRWVHLKLINWAEVLAASMIFLTHHAYYGCGTVPPVSMRPWALPTALFRPFKFHLMNLCHHRWDICGSRISMRIASGQIDWCRLITANLTWKPCSDGDVVPQWVPIDNEIIIGSDLKGNESVLGGNQCCNKSS